MRFSEQTRALIRMRSRERCERCSAKTNSGVIHHRSPRGMGGAANDTTKGTCANGMYLCPRCHDEIERGSRTLALRMGWLVRQGGDPEAVPVKMWDGWWSLSADGTMALVDPQPAEVDGP